MTDMPEEQQPGTPTPDAWQAAIDFGIDVQQLDYNLSLCPLERLQRHDQALELVRALRQAGIQHYGFDPRLPQSLGPPER